MHTWWSWGGVTKYFKNYGCKFSKFDKRYKPRDESSSVNDKHKKHEKDFPCHMVPSCWSTGRRQSPKQPVTEMHCVRKNTGGVMEKTRQSEVNGRLSSICSKESCQLRKLIPKMEEMCCKCMEWPHERGSGKRSWPEQLWKWVSEQLKPNRPCTALFSRW